MMNMEAVSIVDGPPIPNEFVLVHLKPGPGWMKGLMRTNGQWEALFADGLCPVGDPHKVTHWMRLPDDPTF